MGKGGKTYEAKGVDRQSADGVGQEADAKDVKVEDGDAQVPDKVARCEGLDQAAAASVAPDALLLVHGTALLVGEHDPQGQAVDQQGLEERNDVGVPVGLLGAVVGRVELREQASREHGRDDNLDEGVEEGRTDDLVDVQGEGRHAEQIGQGLDGPAQRRDGRERERIAHVGGVAGAVWLCVAQSEPGRKGEKGGRGVGALCSF